MPISTITAKGQVTLPKAIRERLQLKEGDRLEFSIDDAGRIVVRPQRDDTVCGILNEFAPKIPVSIDAMNKAVRRRAAGTVSDGNR